jgi:hypothetical protein
MMNTKNFALQSITIEELSMPVREYEDVAWPVQEAEQNLRIIRDLMERSTKYSTFSGLSGVLAGLISIIGCLIQGLYIIHLPAAEKSTAFLWNWGIVITLAIGVDYVLTKRRARQVGKTILSRLGKQMLLASTPGLGTGMLLTLYFLHRGMIDEVYPFWMLSYGIAVCAVGLFSQKEVSRLGWAFILAGALTLLVQTFAATHALNAQWGLTMIAVSFGGFHIVYGIAVSRRHGW